MEEIHGETGIRGLVQEDCEGVYKELLSLTVYRGLLKRPVTSALVEIYKAIAHLDEEAACNAWGKLCAALAECGRPDSLPAAVAGEILEDENPFVLEAAGSCNQREDGHRVSPSLLSFAKRDLHVLHAAASVDAESMACSFEMVDVGLPEWGNAAAAAPLDKPWDECVDALCAYYRKNGCGPFAAHKAFLWRDGTMLPIDHPDPIRLSDLKDYEYQRRIAVNNTLAFLDGFEANNMLLYGDRGTGKSSTVKALLNEYAGKGLRMVEMPKEFLRQLPDLSGRLAKIPLKFVIFIDDLSFAGDDDHFAALKAVLEGGLAARPDNVVIYATSNRRHLLRESFRDRSGDEIHSADTVQESVSLSDRFGIFLTFLMPDKQHFLDIVAQIADDRHIRLDRPKLFAEAERWALERGARSPRYARQFIADLQARLSRGEEV